MKRIVILFWALMVFSASGMAGMVIQGRTSDGDTYYWVCQDGWSRTGTDRYYVIMDANRQVSYTVMVTEKTYYETTAAESRERLRQMQQSMGAFAKRFGKFFGGGQAATEAEPARPQVTYKKTGQKQTIAGYLAEQVIVFENGRPVREIWVSKKLAQDMAKSCDLKKFAEMVKAMVPSEWQGGFSPQGAESMSWLTKEQELGYPLKEIYYQGQRVQEVTKVEKKELPRSYFSVPAGFKKMSSYGGGYPGNIPQGGGMPW
ncbi:DUF4412 domain-containing protein [Thermosulfurimonas dismutans]|uniref:DUF4412 domain-containing protein n=1 Tax=Thermosulfurimonas dismutans TaxID=999894 RepID=A0A179D6Y1_9BACT|nr:DUF4412 domain-containing protein [Thermosulfurimonas dismutans]OAQ21499.1 hypothetical protein TDIS_0017 [Thermosulfurimonas dismutans]